MTDNRRVPPPTQSAVISALPIRQQPRNIQPIPRPNPPPNWPGIVHGVQASRPRNDGVQTALGTREQILSDLSTRRLSILSPTPTPPPRPPPLSTLTPPLSPPPLSPPPSYFPTVTPPPRPPGPPPQRLFPLSPPPLSPTQSYFPPLPQAQGQQAPTSQVLRGSVLAQQCAIAAEVLRRAALPLNWGQEWQRLKVLEGKAQDAAKTAREFNRRYG
ncbi:hypothetical protein V8F20_012002 [Naviculisporaceae sp. PSN 640]